MNQLNDWLGVAVHSHCTMSSDLSYLKINNGAGHVLAVRREWEGNISVEPLLFRGHGIPLSLHKGHRMGDLLVR